MVNEVNQCCKSRKLGLLVQSEAKQAEKETWMGKERVTEHMPDFKSVLHFTYGKHIEKIYANTMVGQVVWCWNRLQY